MTAPQGRDRELPPGQRLAPVWRPSFYGRVPRLDADSWELRVTGATRDGGVTVLDWDRLAELPDVEVSAGMHCVDRRSIPGLLWGGVRFADVVALAPPEPGVEHVVLAAVRGYSSVVLLEDLVRPESLLANRVDGEPLTPEHGWPARAVLPHLYGFKGPKWVVELAYHHRRQEGWWESHGYHPRGRVDQEERWAHQE